MLMFPKNFFCPCVLNFGPALYLFAIASLFSENNVLSFLTFTDEYEIECEVLSDDEGEQQSEPEESETTDSNHPTEAEFAVQKSLPVTTAPSQSEKSNVVSTTSKASQQTTVSTPAITVTNRQIELKTVKVQQLSVKPSENTKELHSMIRGDSLNKSSLMQPASKDLVSQLLNIVKMANAPSLTRDGDAIPNTYIITTKQVFADSKNQKISTMETAEIIALITDTVQAIKDGVFQKSDTLSIVCGSPAIFLIKNVVVKNFDPTMNAVYVITSENLVPHLIQLSTKTTVESARPQQPSTLKLNSKTAETTKTVPRILAKPTIGKTTVTMVTNAPKVSPAVAPKTPLKPTTVAGVNPPQRKPAPFIRPRLPSAQSPMKSLTISAPAIRPKSLLPSSSRLVTIAPSAFKAVPVSAATNFGVLRQSVTSAFQSTKPPTTASNSTTPRTTAVPILPKPNVAFSPVLQLNSPLTVSPVPLILPTTTSNMAKLNLASPIPLSPIIATSAPLKINNLVPLKPVSNLVKVGMMVPPTTITIPQIAHGTALRLSTPRLNTQTILSPMTSASTLPRAQKRPSAVDGESQMGVKRYSARERERTPASGTGTSSTSATNVVTVENQRSEIQMLEKNIMKIEREIGALRKRILWLKKRRLAVKHPIDTNADERTLEALLRKYLEADAMQFFIAQVKVSGKAYTQFRWTEDDKLFALGLLYKNPAEYNLLCRKYDLPSDKTLTKFVAAVKKAELSSKK